MIYCKKCLFVFLVILTISSSVPVFGAVEELISGLSSPVRLVAPEGDSRLFVVQRNGRIQLFNQAGQSLGTFLDISDQTTTGGERGCLGLAFPPDYSATGRFYVSFTDLSGDSRIARFLVDPENSNRALPSSQENLLVVDQPEGNHNGGHIEFGADGMLYFGLGDGGGAGDQDNNAQNPLLLLGKMLRLDVSPQTGYSIPSDNPFLDSETRDEIWATGLRNPWCFSFDRITGDLYIADVGQGQLEEIDIQPASSTGGENYGWRLMEGTNCYNPSVLCNDGTLVLPVFEYDHNGFPSRCSISGGYVYRGESIPAMQGYYLFSDYCSNQIWALKWNVNEGLIGYVDLTSEMTPSGGFGAVVSFGQDGFGELYIIDIAGKIFRIVGAASPVPELLAPPVLAQNSPNPFNPTTDIRFTLNRAEDQVTLAVYNLAGQLVKTLVQSSLPDGEYIYTWDGTDSHGLNVGSGIYLYTLTTGQVTYSKKMVMLE